MRVPGSVKFSLVVVGVILVAWLGYSGYATYRLKDVVINPIEPGRVNVVAVSPKAGYRIIVANQIAYLAKVEGGFEAGEMDENAASSDVSNASRLPLRELMQTMQGDEAALGVLVMRLNDWSDSEVENGGKVWKAEKIEKALNGDAQLARRLEQDLNVDLQGRPLGHIDVKAVMNGIVVDSPVEVDVNVGGTRRKMVGRVQETYQPAFCSTVERRINERFDPSSAYIKGIYTEEAEKISNGEDVARSLGNRIRTSRLQQLAGPTQQVLDNTVVLLNEHFVESASFRTYDVGQGQTSNDIRIGLKQEGRMRLWKYSRENRGFQLLFVVDTIAIAAPRITTELAESSVTIQRVPSKELVADAVALLNEIIGSKT